jgi:hypothetical protein
MLAETLDLVLTLGSAGLAVVWAERKVIVESMALEMRYGCGGAAESLDEEPLTVCRTQGKKPLRKSWGCAAES